MADGKISQEARVILAGRNATRVFQRSMNAWNTLFTFRSMGQLGLPAAKEHIDAMNRQTVTDLATAEENAELFTVDRKVLIESGYFDDAAKRLTETAVNTFESSLDAASLIFAHSVLDGGIIDWLNICFMVNPNDFLPAVGRRQFSLVDAENTTFSQLLNSAIRAYLEQLGRESLLKKMETLFRLCQPPAGLVGPHGYRYDRDRLEALDALRHRYVHGDAAGGRLPAGDDDILFLHRTDLYGFLLVNRRYGVRLDPTMMAGPVMQVE